jgi:hypothetical protein
LSAKGECVGFDARIQKLDLKRAIRHRATLPNRLVEPPAGHHSRAAGIHIPP